MGQTQKPLHIVIDKSLYDINEEQWVSLRAQGHTIEIITGIIPDLYLAKHAMRMTVDMLLQLPSSFTLAIAGARALRYPPTAKDTAAWKGGKGAKGKGSYRRKDTAIKVEVINPREPPTQAENQGTGGSAVSPTSTATNNEGATQTE